MKGANAMDVPAFRAAPDSLRSARLRNSRARVRSATRMLAKASRRGRRANAWMIGTDLGSSKIVATTGAPRKTPADTSKARDRPTLQADS